MTAFGKLTDEEFAEACATFEELGKKIFSDFAHRVSTGDSSRVGRVTSLMTALPTSVVRFSVGIFYDNTGVEIALDGMRQAILAKAVAARRVIEKEKIN